MDRRTGAQMDNRQVTRWTIVLPVEAVMVEDTSSDADMFSCNFITTFWTLFTLQKIK